MYKGVELDTAFRYVIILKEADKLCNSLKNKWHENKEKSIEMQLREAYKIRNNAFAGLMREGFSCSFVRDFELDSNEIVSFIIKVDGETYECRENVIRDILGDDYIAIVERYKNNIDEEISVITNSNNKSIANNESSNMQIPETEKKAEATDKIKEESFVLDDENTCVDNDNNKNSHTDTNSLSSNSEKKAVKNTKLKESKLKPKSNSTKPKTENPKPSFSYKEPDKPETRKKLKTMLFDFNDVGIINKESKTGEYVNFTIAPLSIPVSGEAIVCDIFVCMETNEDKKLFVSGENGTKTVSTKIGEYEFLVKGSFESGKFISEIYPANTMTSNEYVKKENKTSYAPKDFKDVGFGHVVDFIKNDDDSISKAHILPLELNNNGSGMVNIMMCVENPDGTRNTYVSDDNFIIHKTGKLTYQIFGYWDNEEFISRIKLRD